MKICLTPLELKKIAQKIVSEARELKNKYEIEPNAPVNYACIFSQSEKEFQVLLEAAEKSGKIIEQTRMGPLFQITPIPTVAGDLQLLKIRLPDKNRPERGDADFTLEHYLDFKSKCLTKPGFALIKKEKFEMIELADKNFNVLAYFSHPPLTEQFGLV